MIAADRSQKTESSDDRNNSFKVDREFRSQQTEDGELTSGAPVPSVVVRPVRPWSAVVFILCTEGEEERGRERNGEEWRGRRDKEGHIEIKKNQRREQRVRYCGGSSRERCNDEASFLTSLGAYIEGV